MEIETIVVDGGVSIHFSIKKYLPWAVYCYKKDGLAYFYDENWFQWNVYPTKKSFCLEVRLWCPNVKFWSR